MERLQQVYLQEIVPHLKQQFGYKNIMQVPKLTKIVINVGVGKIVKDAKMLEAVIADIAKITGQQPVKTLSRKSIAGFKLRENQVVGVTVTLRGYRMYSFLDKLINVTLPRVKDFRGVPVAGFDGRGNYHLGLKEHLVFPEISADALDRIFGLQVSLVTNAGSDAPTQEMLKAFRFPLRLEK